MLDSLSSVCIGVLVPTPYTVLYALLLVIIKGGRGGGCTRLGLEGFSLFFLP